MFPRPRSGSRDTGVGAAFVKEMTYGYMVSRILAVCAELGIFQALGEAGSLPADQIAARLSLNAERTDVVLSACVSLGLLERDDAGSYSLGSLAQGYLTPESPSYLGNWAIEYADQGHYAAWAGLKEALSSGGGTDAMNTARRRFEITLDAARGLFDVVDVTQVQRMLELGTSSTGYGAYAYAAAERQPSMDAIIQGGADPVERTQELLRAAGAPASWQVHAIATEVPALPGDLDLVVIGGWLGAQPREGAAPMLAQVMNALKPGGALVVHDHLLNDSKTGPVFATMYNVHLMLTRGMAPRWSLSEVRQLVQATGFHQVQTVAVDDVYSAIAATRPV